MVGGAIILILVIMLLNKSANKAEGMNIPQRQPSMQQGRPMNQPPPMQAGPSPPRPQGPPPQGYETKVGSGKPALVMFYAEWCGHSKQLMPGWQQLTQTLNQTGKLDVISLEQKGNENEMRKHGVTGFPTIRFYPEGFPGANPIEYSGNRTVDSLIKFARSGGQEA